MIQAVEKNWTFSPPIPDDINREFERYPKLFRQVLFNRGFMDSKSAEKFLNTDYELHDPFLLPDMEIASNLILSAIEKKKRIVVFGDYDVDGVTATVLLIETLWKLGGNAMKFIPNRFKHGYGFSFDALEDLQELDPDLIITVDCGVRSVDEIAAVKKKGINIVITDHHQPHFELPPADAIICPKIPESTYPNQDLAGVGLAYKLAQAITRNTNENIDPDDQLDLVALGTIADLAKLVPENRLLVNRGLKIIHSGKRPGLKALADVCGLKIHGITAENIGFILGPRLNAAGRLKSADDAYQLLIAEDRIQAAPFAISLDQLNRDRQTVTREIQKKAEKVFAVSKQEWVLFNSNEEYNEGVVGLVASRLAETYYRPAIIGNIKNDVIRASCRSIPEINITELLDQCEDLLIQHGGHAMAAGLSIQIDQVDKFLERISGLVCDQLKAQQVNPTINGECEASLFDLEPELLKSIERLEPTGEGNPKPLFISRRVQVLYPKTVGANNDHLKFSIRSKYPVESTSHGSISFNAIAFWRGYQANQLEDGSMVDILYSFEKNYYNGRESLQLNIQDIKLL